MSAAIAVVGSLKEAKEAADTAEDSLILLSPPGAAAYMGPLFWLALVEEARAHRPALSIDAILDCAEREGDVLAALRAGCKSVIFTGGEETAAKLAQIAEQMEARLLTARPVAQESDSGR